MEKERLSGTEWVLSFHPVLPSFMTIKKSLLSHRHAFIAIKNRARRHQLNNFYVTGDRSWLILGSETIN